MQCEHCRTRIESESYTTHVGRHFCSSNCSSEWDEAIGRALLAGVPTPIDDTLERYCVQITGLWRKSVAAIIETGNALAAAKDYLPHGAWIPLVEQHLPFGPRTAQRLMQISGVAKL